jgi:hypothetical protein
VEQGSSSATTPSSRIPPTDEWVVELGCGHDDRAYMRAVRRVVIWRTVLFDRLSELRAADVPSG